MAEARARGRPGLALALAAGLALPVVARAAAACDLALAFAVDVSGSVDTAEYRTQMQGLADGLRDAVVSEALVVADARLLLVQWTGSSRQAVTLPWTRIDTFEALDRFAAQVEAAPRRWRNFSTAIGEALQVTAGQFAEAPACRRRIIDISGDGASNEGIAPERVHGALARAGITVNALVIAGAEPDLTGYFRDHVIAGEGAFVMTANSYAEYPDRMRRKLLREVARQLSRRRAGCCAGVL